MDLVFAQKTVNENLKINEGTFRRFDWQNKHEIAYACLLCVNCSRWKNRIPSVKWGHIEICGMAKQP